MAIRCVRTRTSAESILPLAEADMTFEGKAGIWQLMQRLCMSCELEALASLQ